MNDTFSDQQTPVLQPARGVPDRYRADAPPALVADAREFVASCHWVWAKTFASFAPHWYTLRRQARPVESYDALRALIREHHYPRPWRGRTFRSVTLDGLLLWIMQDDDPEQTNGGSVLVNAKPAEPTDWPQPSLFD